jgi:hypothetical protein
MPTWKTTLVFALFLSLMFTPLLGCSGDDDDNDDDNDDAVDDDAADDDAADDDTADDDDDTSDDDDDDDTAPPAPPFLGTEIVFGGSLDNRAVGLAVTPDGATHAVAVKNGKLIHYTQRGDTTTTEELTVGAALPALAADAAGNLHVVYYDAVGGEVVYLRHTGQIWTAETALTVAPAVVTDIDLALDNAGEPHITVAHGGLDYATRTSRGWDAVTAPNVGLIREGNLALDAAGYPHIAYTGYTDQSFVDYLTFNGSAWAGGRLATHVLETWGGDCSTYYTFEGIDLALDAAGRPHVTYGFNQMVQCLIMIESTAVVVHGEVDGDGNWTMTPIGFESGLVQDTALANRDGIEAMYTSSDLSLWEKGAKGNIPGDLYHWTPAQGVQTIDEVALGGLAFVGGDRPRVAWFKGTDNLTLAEASGAAWIETQLDTIVPVDGLLDAAVGPDGLLRAVFAGKIDHQVHLATEGDAGWRIENVTTLSRTPESVAVAVDAEGWAHVAVVDGGGLAYAVNDGDAWTFEQIEDAETWVVDECDLAVDAAGTPHIAYHVDTEAGERARLAVGGGSWDIQTIGVSEGGQMSLALDADGLAAVLHGGYDLRYVRETADGWQDDRLNPTPGKRADNVALALAADGTPHVAFSSGFGQFLEYGVRDGDTWTIQRLVWTGYQERVGRVDIALDAADDPYIAFHRLDQENLWLGFAEQGAWHPEAIAESNVGDYPAVLVTDDRVQAMYVGQNALWRYAALR